MSSQRQLKKVVIKNIWPWGWARSGGIFGVRGTRGMGGGALGFGSVVGQPGTAILQPVTPETNNHRSMASNEKRVLTEDNVNYNLKIMEYAVRGPLLIRANEIEKELEKVNDSIDSIHIKRTLAHLNSFSRTPFNLDILYALLTAF